jgi:hypothetical protein
VGDRLRRTVCDDSVVELDCCCCAAALLRSRGAALRAQRRDSSTFPLRGAHRGRHAACDAVFANRRSAMTTLTNTLPTTGELTATTATTAEAVTSIDQLEAYIARHLLGWGAPATFLGMALGYHFGSFAGAVPSAAIGTVVGVLTGTAVAAYKRRQR